MACQSRHEPVPSTGLTVLFEPNEPSLDIVFVHGFTGHPERTWTHTKGDAKFSHQCPDTNDPSERPSKIRKLFPTSRDQGASSYVSLYWPRDLLPVTIPYARVLTYGYDTRVSHVLGPSGNKSSVYEMAWDFLVELEAERRTDATRPVLFIAHSLGGIFVKEALRRSGNCQFRRHLGSIFNSAIGIIFFGTPHGGADPRGFLQRVAEKIVKATGFSVNENVVNTLLPSAERLRELRDEFNPVVNRQNWTIYSFQEAIGVACLGGEKVVDDTSSYLNLPDIETTQHIGRNHMDMCRFSGLNDAEFKKVAAALTRVTGLVSQRRTAPQAPILNEEQKRSLLDSLGFDEVDSRWMSIKNAHTKTCKWLLKKSEYLDWLDTENLPEHHGFLWMKGKPGTGKSTLMKFALANSRKSMRDKTILSFFFNARGSDLEKSTSGMYRSLLLQLLKRLPHLQVVFESPGFTNWNTSSDRIWSIELLKDLFQQAVQSLGQHSVTCFIDALDECDLLEARDMVAYFQLLGDLTTSAGIRFQVFFSSRHYPHITISRGINITLEGQEGHEQDITDYVDSELRIGQTSLARKIRADLQEKSSGVFMWVVLVVGILNQEHDEGRPARRLQQKLKEIPGDLHELFRDILMRDSRNKDELLLCIQWLLFTRRPLNPSELYFAILSGTEPEDISAYDPSEMPPDAIKRFILNSSKGLAEVTRSKRPTVQFIHESVRDFLVKENGLSEVWSNLGRGFEGESHEVLKRSCVGYMSITFATILEIRDPFPKASSAKGRELRQKLSGAFPLLEYAVENILWHADAAQSGGICQKDFLRDFDLITWLRLANIFEKFDIRQHSPTASILYVLGEYSLPALIAVHENNRHAFIVEDERYGPPIFAALACGNCGAVTAMLEALEQIPDEVLPTQTKWGSDKGKNSTFGRDFCFSRRRGVLSYLAEKGDQILVGFVLATGQVDANLRDSHGRTPLSYAASGGYEGVVKLLLATGQVGADSKDKDGRTPLSWAASTGREGVVKLLLATGQVDADSKDKYNRTPLSYAASGSHEGVVKLLLVTGQVEADSKDKNGKTPLGWAALEGRDGMVKLLLATGQVDADSKDKDGRTLLNYAARGSHEGMVKLLLATGQVGADSKDKYGRTPLSWAASAGREGVVKLLLTAGLVDADSKDKDGRTLLNYAARGGHEGMVKLLLAAGQVGADSKDKNGRTPLSWAASAGREGVVKLLLATGQVDADSKDEHGRTPLSLAARGGHEGTVKLLLATGQVDADSKDEHGRTPLSLAARGGHEGTVKLLLATGQVDADSKDSHGWTPLNYAARRSHEGVVKLLLATGQVDADSKDSHGTTPLSYAAWGGHKGVVKLLLATGRVDTDSEDSHGWTPLSCAAMGGHEGVALLFQSEESCGLLGTVE